MSHFSWQRAVIKVGSALVSPDGEGCSTKYLRAIVDFIVASKRQGKQVIIVSSGSIAAARNSIKTGHKATIAEKQAMAAIGQSKMIANWTQLFDRLQTAKTFEQYECAQILLTVEDLADRQRFVNIKNTLETLLANNIIPIVNENDTVAIDEIKVGDNDNLAAHTAIATQSDSLIICTDVDGLFTSNPRVDSQAKLLPNVQNIDSKIMLLAGGAGTSVGTGGMVTKLQAAQKATGSGIQTLLVNGTKETTFTELVKGVCLGTLFTPKRNQQSARDDWLTHTSKIRGTLNIDRGAANALTKSGASLLAAGVVEVLGQFNEGQSIEVCIDAKTLGKGIVNYSSTELKRILGCKSTEIQEILGYTASETVVHRDNFVLINQTAY